MNELEKIANLVREGLEDFCKDNDGDMIDYFGDGSIYGEDGEGRLIVGFGVYGNANIAIGVNCVNCGGYDSKEFSENLKKGLAEFRSILENC